MNSGRAPLLTFEEAQSRPPHGNLSRQQNIRPKGATGCHRGRLDASFASALQLQLALIKNEAGPLLIFGLRSALLPCSICHLLLLFQPPPTCLFLIVVISDINTAYFLLLSCLLSS